MKIILLNGPPSSGKDTALRAIAEALTLHGKPQNYIPYATGKNFQPRCLRMSAPIKEAFASVFGQDVDQWGEIPGMTQARKEQINPTLGCSPRQWQIDFSERFMKPLYGGNVFARIFLHRVSQLMPDTVVIVPDCGFQIELNSIWDAAVSPDYPYFTSKDLFLVRLYRKGFDFSRDSRQYVYDLGRGKYLDDGHDFDNVIREADILNEDKDLFCATIIRQVTSFLKGEP